MQTRTLFVFLLVVAFVGTTSCGDLTGDTSSKDKDAEIRALHKALAERSKPGATVTEESVTTATAIVQFTNTKVGSGTATSTSTGGSVYTITGTAGGTTTRTGTSTSSSTSTAGRE